MDTMTLTAAPVMRTGMLIRRPAADVFEALVNPEITSQVWFTSGSGRLEPGAQVQWDWEMYGASASVTVLAVEPPVRIAFTWPGLHGPTVVEWSLEARPEGTFATVTESGFAGTGDELVRQVADSTEGFALLLAGLKALLEHGVRLGLVADRHPAGLGAS
jgi:uncharacterized protein YndB with AHSA1/START domain